MSIIDVHRWISKKEKISYKFGDKSDNPDIPLVIFQDDSLNKALTKIAIGIIEYHKIRKEDVPSIHKIPYVWTNNKSLRFELNPNITANPWNMDLDKLPAIKTEQINYIKDSLLINKTINIVFEDDIPDKLKTYYFPEKVNWKPEYSKTEIFKESKNLYNLWNIVQNEPEEKRTFVFSKLRFFSDININKYLSNYELTHINTKFLSLLFENIHTSTQFPFIQYIQDTSRILYKLWKTHSIPSTFIQNWTYYDKLPKVEMIIAMIPLFDREHSFARTTIDKNGIISIQYQIDSRDKIELENIKLHLENIKKWLENIIKQNLIFKVESISGKGEFATQGLSLQDVSINIGKGIFIPLYHVIKLQNSVLTIAFKRSQNYQNQIDIADYISSNIKLGISLQEIAQNLIDLGLSQKDVTLWIEQYQTQIEAEIDLPKKKSISFTGCIFKIEKHPYGFRILMENVATFEELKYIYRWVRATFKYIMQEYKPPTAPSKVQAGPSKVVKQESEEKSEETTTTTKTSKSISESSRESGEDILQQEIEFEGGAVKKGKGTDRYFLTQLQQADPTIFLDTKNYARLCAANNFRQPIIVTPEEKERIDREGYSDSYDDSILYGSDKQHLNHYMCPRIWCPTARIPLTEKQLEDNGGKCPGPHFEKPMKLYENKYWDENPKIPHHIGFHKQKTPTGLCLPCCMKNPLKEKEIANCKINESEATGLRSVRESEVIPSPRKKPKVSQTQTSAQASQIQQSKDDARYIMGAVAPLPKDRFGAIPKDLHAFLQPKIPYQLCSKTISSTECFLRKGIEHGNDSLMNAITIALGLKSKKDLIKNIIKHLTPLKFISIANGHLLTAFMNQEPYIGKVETKLIKQWMHWIKEYKFTSYINLLGGIDKIKNDEIILSRELAIYKAYNNFISYLLSNDTKNPEHLELVLLSMNIILLVWKRQDNVATLQCATYETVEDIFEASENKKIAMLLQENNYFEPIELKQSNKESIALFDVSGKLSKDLQAILKQCPLPYKFDSETYSREMTFIGNIRNLVSWINIRLFNANPFLIKSVILRQDLKIYGFLTRANLLIRGPQEGILCHILPDLFEIIPTLSNILYIEDIANQKYHISEIFTNDFILYRNKIQDLGFALNSGTIQINDNNESPLIEEGELVIEPLNLSIIPTIRTRTYDVLYMNEKSMTTIDKKWTQLQYAIGNTVLKYYDTLVKPLLNKTRKERIRILMNTFPKLPDKEKIQTILEEIPLEYGKDAIAKWVISINLEKKNIIFTSSFIQNANNNKEWVFSQAAIENGLPLNILKPVKSIHASEKYGQNRVIDYQTDTGNKSINEKTDTSNLPTMLLKSLNDIHSLPTKWNQAKGYNWNKYYWYKLKDYTKNSLPELFEWIAHYINTPFDWNEVREIRNKFIIGILQDKEATLKIFEDPSIVNAWKVALKKKYKDGLHIWNKTLDNLKYKERIALWNNVVDKDIEEELIWPADLDLKIIASLMNIGILVIYRGKYGEGIEADKKTIFDDLYISSTFYYGNDWKKRPCIILFRTVEKDHITYSSVVHSENIFIHKTAQNMSSNILQLLEYHITKDKDSSFSSASTSSAFSVTSSSEESS